MVATLLTLTVVHNFRMAATKIMIQGERLDGKHPMSKERFLALVTRGLALPLQEVLTKNGWNAGPVVSVVLALDTGRRRVKSSHYVVNGLIYDSAIKAEKVKPLFIFSQLNGHFYDAHSISLCLKIYLI